MRSVCLHLRLLWAWAQGPGEKRQMHRAAEWEGQQEEAREDSLVSLIMAKVLEVPEQVGTIYVFSIPRCPHEVGSSPKSTEFQWEPSEMQSKSKVSV